MNCICDNCEQEIHIEAKDIKNKIIDNIEVSYFKCKYCNDKYITTCIDDYIKKEQKRYFKLSRMNGKHEATLKALENMKVHSDRLKLKVIKLL